MKKKNWYRSLGLADEQYIAEAAPTHDVKPKRNKVYISLVTACACLALLLCNLWLFLPFNADPPDVSQYADSAYYDLIQKLNVLTFQRPKHKNNAAKLWSSLKKLAPEDDDFDSIEDSVLNGTDGASGYKEITDNQEEGIIEADRIKRSDTHVYYLSDRELRVYAIDKENTKEVGSYTFQYRSGQYALDQWELYLSADCKTATVISQYYSKSYGDENRYVNLTALDVSDPTRIVKKEEFTVTGKYMSSRLTGGSILLLTEFAVDRRTLDFDDESTFLPQIDLGNGAHSLPAEAIVSPEALNSARYTVVMKLDEGSLDLQGAAAYLSYSEDVYVSAEHVFLTHVFADEKQNEDGSVTRNSMTEISCLAYGGESLERKGSVTVRGYVKDQWSMDEHEGILRVFTTTNATTLREYTSRDGSVIAAEILQTATGQSNASLYCVDLSTFEVVASVIDFAPPREEIQSVRFDGTAAYVCTSIELSDPVFFFDLSDLNNVTYKDTGTIEGFSTSLINLGNGYLLGIGRGEAWNSFKVEVYEETADGVRAVCAYERKNTEYSTEYKSYYVDRQNQLVGIGVTDNTKEEPSERGRYLLLYFDGYQLEELADLSLIGAPAYKRGFYEEDYLYAFAPGGLFAVQKVLD